MKKIFRLLLLGFLTVTFITPNVVNAEECQVNQEPSSSVYHELDNIAPMNTPLITEVTLNTGESYEMSQKCFALKGKHTYISFKIRSISGQREAFTLNTITTLPGITNRDAYYNEASVHFVRFTDKVHTGLSEIHDGGVVLTNYSSEPIKYRIGLNIVYELEDIYFELG